MSASTLEAPAEDLLLSYELDFELGFGLADCECSNHSHSHSLPGPCDQRASWRLTARAIMGAYSPTVSELLCRECLDAHVRMIEATRPTLEVSVKPL